MHPRSHDPGGSRTEVRFASAIPRIEGTSKPLADLASKFTIPFLER